jgi:PAS domain S-box-containing protein
MLQRQNTKLGNRHDFVFADASGGRDLHVVTAPIGFGSRAILAAGSRGDTFPTRTEELLLNTGANQAAIAFQQWLGDVEKRRFTAVVQRTTDFVGIASLNGQVQYVNPAGLQLVGLDTPDDALRLHVLDFVSSQHRKTVQDEVWPLVLRMGRWKGELDFRHFESSEPIAFLIDSFRIDDPRTGEPMNVATVSRDLTAQKNSETTLRDLNENLERRVEERLADANKRLLAEKLEREQADLRFQKLQNELSRAARLTAAGQMAAALAHEISQPLTAVVNSVKAAKRLLARGGTVNFLAAQGPAGEAAEQALRAGEIVRSVRQLVNRGETERRIEALSSMIEETTAIVLGSLGRNAFEAMADQEPRKVTVSTRALDDETIEIAVADVGPGIPYEIAARLFEPFASSKHVGMGLGLSISRSIIEAHEGQLNAEQIPEGGTIFRFTLPSGRVADG